MGTQSKTVQTIDTMTSNNVEVTTFTVNALTFIIFRLKWKLPESD